MNARCLFKAKKAKYDARMFSWKSRICYALNELIMINGKMLIHAHIALTNIWTRFTTKRYCCAKRHGKLVKFPSATMIFTNLSLCGILPKEEICSNNNVYDNYANISMTELWIKTLLSTKDAHSTWPFGALFMVFGAVEEKEEHAIILKNYHIWQI